MMKYILLAALIIAAISARAQQQLDPQQVIAQQAVVIQYLQREIDAKAARIAETIAAANLEIEKLRKQVAELTPKDSTKR